VLDRKHIEPDNLAAAWREKLMKRTILPKTIIGIAVVLFSLLGASRILAITTKYIDDHGGSSQFELSGTMPWDISESYCYGGKCWQYLQYTGGNGYTKGKWKEPSSVPSGITSHWYVYIPDNPDTALDGTVVYKGNGGSAFTTVVNQQGWQGQWVYLGSQITLSATTKATMTNACAGGGYPCDAWRQVWWDHMKMQY
jgi:hypothetical protein